MKQLSKGEVLRELAACMLALKIAERERDELLARLKDSTSILNYLSNHSSYYEQIDAQVAENKKALERIK